jgi:hypothetical protein
MTFAEQTNRTFFFKGGPYPATLENIVDELELREQSLPPKEDWEKAVSRAGALFGLVVPQTLNATNITKLLEGVVAKVREIRPIIDSLTTKLAQKIQSRVPRGMDTPRLKTAQSAQALLASLTNVDPGAVCHSACNI